MLDACVDRGVAGGIVGDELLEAEVAAAAQCAAATHQGVAAALDQQ